MAENIYIEADNFKNTFVTLDNDVFDGNIETTGDIGKCNHSNNGGIIGYGGSSNISFNNIRATGTITDSSDFSTSVGGLCGGCDGNVNMNDVDVSQIELNVSSNAKGEWKKVDNLIPTN